MSFYSIDFARMANLSGFFCALFHLSSLKRLLSLFLVCLKCFPKYLTKIELIVITPFLLLFQFPQYFLVSNKVFKVVFIVNIKHYIPSKTPSLESKFNDFIFTFSRSDMIVVSSFTSPRCLFQ